MDAGIILTEAAVRRGKMTVTSRGACVGSDRNFQVVWFTKVRKPVAEEIPRKKTSTLEDLASLIPGYSGYQSLESRREDDRNTRKFVASRLAACKKVLDRISKAAIERGDMDTPSQLEKYRTRIDLAQNRVLAAVEGYVGWFSERKVDLELLKRIGELDANLIALVNQLDDWLQKTANENISLSAVDVTELLDTLHARIDRRRELLQGEVG